MPATVVGLGELVWDHLPGERLPGGAPSNFVFHARQLGASATLVSAIGDDKAGADIASWLAEVGISDEFLQINQNPTGKVTVELDAVGHPHYTIHQPVAWDYIDWNPQLDQLAQETDCVCVGTLAQRSPISRNTINQFLASTRPDCLRVFDINLRSPFIDAQVIGETLQQCDLLKLNHHEWPIIAQQLNLHADVAIGARQLIQNSRIRTIAITRGDAGSTVIDSTTSHNLPGQRLKIADTVGAGDSFTATLAMDLLRGMNLKIAHHHAAAVSAYVCTQHGATPTLPRELCEPTLAKSVLV